MINKLIKENKNAYLAVCGTYWPLTNSKNIGLKKLITKIEIENTGIKEAIMVAILPLIGLCSRYLMMYLSHKKTETYINKK